MYSAEHPFWTWVYPDIYMLSHQCLECVYIGSHDDNIYHPTVASLDSLYSKLYFIDPSAPKIQGVLWLFAPKLQYLMSPDVGSY